MRRAGRAGCGARASRAGRGWPCRGRQPCGAAIGGAQRARLEPSGATPGPAVSESGSGRSSKLRSPSTTRSRMKAAVIKETAPGERRVALVPEAVRKLTAAGFEVLVESGAGDRAWHSDDSYRDAGARIVSQTEAVSQADAVLTVGKPDATTIAGLGKEQALLGMLAPLTDPDLVRELAQTGVTAVSLDLIPRTLPRAQQMDALSSQANIAGYKAVLIAAATYGRFFPLLITAAGTARPAKAAGPRRRGSRPAGHRHGPAARRSRQRLRRAAGDQDRGGVARRHLHRADRGRPRLGFRRIRARADRGRARGSAGGAGRAHRPAGCHHHHRAGPRPQAAAAGHGARAGRRWRPDR